MSELRQTHNNMHNIDNSITTFKQRIEGYITTFRSTAESVNDLQQQVDDIDTHQSTLISDVRLMQFALRDRGIMYVDKDDEDDVDGTSITTNSDNNDECKDKNNNTTNDSHTDSTNNNDDNPAADVDSPTAPRSLKEYASTITPASRAIQAHTTSY